MRTRSAPSAEALDVSRTHRNSSSGERDSLEGRERLDAFLCLAEQLEHVWDSKMLLTRHRVTRCTLTAPAFDLDSRVEALAIPV